MVRGIGFGGGTRYVGNTGKCVVVDVRQTIGKASGEAVDEVDTVEMEVVLLFVDVTSRW